MTPRSKKLSILIVLILGIVPLRSLGQDFLYFVIDKITVVDTLNNDIDYKIEFWHGDSIVNVKRAKFKQHDVYLCESIPANSQLIIYVNKNAYKIDSLVKYIGYSTKVRLIMFYRGHSDCYSLTSNVPPTGLSVSLRPKKRKASA